MSDRAAPIRLIQKTGLNERARVLGNGFQVCLQLVGNALHPNPLASLDSEQNGNAPMVRRALEVALELLWCFHRSSLTG